MNMHMHRPVPRIAISAGLACIAANALLAQELEIDKFTSAQLRTAYLECDRITAESRVDQDFMIACQRVGDVLRDRDFGGDFELQLRWWRAARDASRSHRGPEILPAATDRDDPRRD